jgi:hypothetical protein
LLIIHFCYYFFIFVFLRKKMGILRIFCQNGHVLATGPLFNPT